MTVLSTKLEEGWVCPLCDSVISPTVDECVVCNGTEEQLQGAMMEHVISDPYESNQLPLTNPFILAEPTTLINSPLPKYWVTRETGVVPSTYIQTVGTSATSPEYDITTQLSLFDTSDGA